MIGVDRISVPPWPITLRCAGAALVGDVKVRYGVILGFDPAWPKAGLEQKP